MTWSVARGALFLACVFAMHCLSVRDVLCAEGLKRTAVGEGFSYGNFVRDQFHYLNATKVGSSLVQDVEVCNVACVANPSCVSFNVAAEPDIHGHLLCELLATDKYNSSDQFVAHPEFHHHSIYTPCSDIPCKNGGTCIALYHDGAFKCKCPAGFKGQKCDTAVKECSDYYNAGVTANGVYSVDPDGQGAFPVYCDMTTDGGPGWTVFQRRQDGSQDFHLGWGEYKAGFGNLTGEFWLGLDKIHRLTASRPSKLRVEIENWSGNKKYAKYGTFQVGDEQALYRLSVGSYSGTAGDSLWTHNNMKFSTKDRDNDKSGGVNCAADYGGGWWFKTCHPSNLNGHYIGNKWGWHGVIWYNNMGTLSLKFSEMKLRQKN